MIDYTIVRQRDVDEARDTRAIRGADCGTGHVMLRSRTMIKRKLQCNKSGSKPPRRFNAYLQKNSENRRETKQRNGW